MDRLQNVLFLCTRNSARSQMAEGLLRALAGDRFQVYSAGLDPDRVHPTAVEVMREVGIDISQQRSKDVKEYLGKLLAHYLILVCADAEKHCPTVFPGMVERLSWPLEDPAAAEGSQQQQLAAFRRVRDQLDERLRAWLQSLDRQAP